MNKFERFVYGACKLVELGSIVGLAAIGLKRNHDCYKAECKNVDLNCELIKKDIDMICKDAEIRKLQQEVSELRTKYKTNEEEA